MAIVMSEGLIFGLPSNWWKVENYNMEGCYTYLDCITLEFGVVVETTLVVVLD